MLYYYHKERLDLANQLLEEGGGGGRRKRRQGNEARM